MLIMPFCIKRFNGNIYTRRAASAISVDALLILALYFRQIPLTLFDMIDTRRFAVVKA